MKLKAAVSAAAAAPVAAVVSSAPAETTATQPPSTNAQVDLLGLGIMMSILSVIIISRLNFLLLVC